MIAPYTLAPAHEQDLRLSLVCATEKTGHDCSRNHLAIHLLFKQDIL